MGIWFKSQLHFSPLREVGLGYACRKAAKCTTVSLVPGLPLSFSHSFLRVNITRKKIEAEGEPGTEPHPPMATVASYVHDHGSHVLYCAQYRSCAALWIVATSLRSHKDS